MSIYRNNDFSECERNPKQKTSFRFQLNELKVIASQNNFIYNSWHFYYHKYKADTKVYFYKLKCIRNKFLKNKYGVYFNV